jgi:hypothetical protein
LKLNKTEKKKMNRKIFYGAFLFVILATGISSRSLGDSGINVVNNNSSDNGPTLMQMLQNILEDPEYLALSDEEQLAVLEVIYSLLQTNYIQRKSKSEYHGNSAFVNLK